MKHTQAIIVSIMLIAVFLLGTIAFAANHPGYQAPISIKPAGAPGKYYPALLSWYVDAPDADCVDSDGGFNPIGPGTVTYKDGTGSSSFVAEMCAGPSAVVETTCVKNANVKETNGKQKHNYMIMTIVKCADVGKTTCTTTTGGFPMAYCK